MTKSLKDYFPMIRSREEVLKIIYEQKELKKTFGLWNKEEQNEFLNLCTGARGTNTTGNSIKNYQNIDITRR